MYGGVGEQQLGMGPGNRDAVEQNRKGTVQADDRSFFYVKGNTTSDSSLSNDLIAASLGSADRQIGLLLPGARLYGP